jgi:hypothetical protein
MAALWVRQPVPLPAAVLASPFEDLAAGLLEASPHRVGRKRAHALVTAYRDSIGVPAPRWRREAPHRSIQPMIPGLEWEGRVAPGQLKRRSWLSRKVKRFTPVGCRDPAARRIILTGDVQPIVR